MAKDSRSKWPKVDKKDGVYETEFDSWSSFINGLAQEALLNRPEYVFRGHRMSSWGLQPTFDREVRQVREYNDIRASHLRNFKYSARGRRGTNPPDLVENEWWALAQHHGLATPLLDWTESPYVGLYFAFCDLDGPKQTKMRVVWALNRHRVEEKSIELIKSGNSDIVEFINPLTDENARLVNQSGLFTKMGNRKLLQDWVSEHFSGVDYCVLQKSYILNKKRKECLRALNRMNINHSTLFPDLFGASLFANMKLNIVNY